jgi:hypothetical protein
LDEFQNFVGPDLESALPETRQLGLNLVLSHQSFSPLERGDYDMTSMIFAAQSRMIFGVQGEDADILAQEVASLTFDPKRVKDEIQSRRQLIKGHRLMRLESGSEAEADANQWSTTSSKNWGKSEGTSGKWNQLNPERNSSTSESDTEGDTSGRSSSRTVTRGWHDALMPEYENFVELSSRTYQTFDEQKSCWAKEIRQLRTGEAILRLVNDPKLYRVNVKRSTPGYLGYDMQTIARKLPGMLERMDRLIEENFQSEFFVPAHAVDREIEQRVEAVLRCETPGPDGGEGRPGDPEENSGFAS